MRMEEIRKIVASTKAGSPERRKQLERLADDFKFAWALDVPTLYKFKGYRGETVDHVNGMLIESRIYLSSPEEFNDPFDTYPTIGLAGDPKDPAFVEVVKKEQAELAKKRGLRPEEIAELEKNLGTGLADLPAAVQKDIHAELRNTRIFCVSRDQCHPLQWAHYADSHRGVCLHFSSAKSGTFGVARQIEYDPDRVPLDIPFDVPSEKIFTRLALTKADFWGYEKEFRFITRNTDRRLDGRFLKFERSLLTGITLGLAMPDSARKEIMRVLDKHRPELPIWQADRDDKKFWIKVDRVR